MKKIALIKNSGLGAGGVERWMQFSAYALQHHYKVYYLHTCLHQDEGRRSFLENLSIEMHNLSSDYNQNKFDVVKLQEFFVNNNIDLSIVGKADGIEYPYNLIPTKVINRIAFATKVDNSENIVHTVLPSEWLKKKWINAGGPEHKSTVIPSPVAQPSKKSQTTKDSELNIGFHQRCDENIFSYIPIIAYRTNNFPHVNYHIMGGAEKYKRYARLLGLRNITYHSHSSNWEDISEFLSRLDIFAHGRKDGETFGAVFAEALMHGLPCLSHMSRYDNAHVETVGSNGIITKNLFSYHYNLRKLILNHKFRNSLALGAFEWAKRYSIKNNAEKLRSMIKRYI